jgi:oligopeptide transport system permease protein
MNSIPNSSQEAPPARSLWVAWRKLKKNKAAMVSFYLLCAVLAVATFAPWLTPHAFDVQDLFAIYSKPSGTHWLGTDELGRDVFSRLIYGARVSMAVAILSTLTIVVIGTLWGSIAGYFGGHTDSAMMRFVDVLYALPYMFFVIILMLLFGRNLYTLFMAIGALSWLTMARIVRGQVLSLKKQDFVTAAKALGTSDLAIIFKHLLPNTFGTIAVYATITIPRMILLEAFLSFLGLGIQEPTPSWGSLCNDGANALYSAPWLILWPGTMMAITLICFNFLGDGMRDALDPHLRGDV